MMTLTYTLLGCLNSFVSQEEVCKQLHHRTGLCISHARQSAHQQSCPLCIE